VPPDHWLRDPPPLAPIGADQNVATSCVWTLPREEIVECYAMSGEWDYLLRIAVRDVADYDRFIGQGVLAHPSVADAASNFALRQVKYTTEIPV